MPRTQRKSPFGLKSTLKLGGGRRQTLLVVLGLIVALGASFGVYSQFRGAHASGCPYSYGGYTCIGGNNAWGEDMYAWACQTGASNGNNTVRAHFAVYHSRAGNHTYYGGIQNHDSTLPSNYAYSWSWSSGTSVAGFQTLNTSINVDSYHNNYLGFYASYGPYANWSGPAIIGGSASWRPSGLGYC